MVVCKGRVSRIVFRKEGFMIFDLNTKEGVIHCKGNFIGDEIKIQMDIELEGNWTAPHPKYGKALQVSAYKETEPSDVEGIVRYLTANVSGVGYLTAKKIAEHFGEDTVSILTQNPNQITQCTFLTQNQIEVIRNVLQQNTRLRDISIFLMSFDVSNLLVSRIYKQFGEQTIDILTADPYQMMDIRGLGFKKADEIATRMGIDPQASVRIKAVLRYILEEEISREGHLYVTRTTLKTLAAKYLEGVRSTLIDEQIATLSTESKIHISGEKIYWKTYYDYESKSATFLKEIANTRILKTPLGGSADFGTVTSSVNVTQYLDEYDKAHNITLTCEQREAIEIAYTNKVSVITGLPGSGKTTIVKAILGLYDHIYTPKDISLMAPTGIAAKRLSQVTGRKASTIHRAFRSGGDEQTPNTLYEDGWKFNERVKATHRVYVIDEMSMMDMELFYRLVSAIPKDSVLIMVGDVAQLPSVGPGNVLKEVIHSGMVPVISLSTIHRQAAQSDIILNAHRIHSGQMIQVDNSNVKSDFKFLSITDEQAIADKIVQTAVVLKQKQVEYQCLSPKHAGILGVANLNLLLREVMNPDTGQNYITIKDKTFRIGDRIMVTKNNYELKVYNGDMGHILNIDKAANEIQIRIDDSTEPTVYKTIDAINELVLSYCVTIHKIQGDQRDVILLPFIKAFSIQLVRNILYTAITRAKKKVIMYGHLSAVEKAIQTNTVQQRNTALSERIRLSFAETES
jgi:exodeoxyribonuclease V alpha subunit